MRLWSTGTKLTVAVQRQIANTGDSHVYSLPACLLHHDSEHMGVQAHMKLVRSSHQKICGRLSNNLPILPRFMQVSRLHDRDEIGSAFSVLQIVLSFGKDLCLALEILIFSPLF